MNVIRVILIAPDDYIGGEFNVTIPANTTMATLSVTTNKDNLLDDGEYFKAILSIPDGADDVAVGVNMSFVTITDKSSEYNAVYDCFVQSNSANAIVNIADAIADHY